MVRKLFRVLPWTMAAAVAVMASPAQAGWGSWGGSSGYASTGGSTGYASTGYASTGAGSAGSWASTGGSTGGSWGGSRGAGWGSGGGGLLSRIHSHIAQKHTLHAHRRAVRRAYYHSSGGSWGGSSGGSSGGAVSYYGGSHGSWGGSSGGSWGGSSGGSWGGSTTSYRVIESEEAGATDAGDDSAPAPPTEDSVNIRTSNQSLLVVTLPADATLTVNGQPTVSTGAERRFASPALEPGRSYPYTLRAEWMRSGEKVVRIQTVFLRAGDSETLAFADAPATKIETQLTLKVPAEAKVTLAGVETESQGQVRTFATSKLDRGETWQDYVVEVSIAREGGDPQTQRRSLALIGGESYDLEFSFDEDRVALND